MKAAIGKDSGVYISTDFPGGNIKVKDVTENAVSLDNELRDTEGDWFYWAFCVTGAKGKTFTFDFGEKARIGYFGPAVSFDLKNWSWLDGQSTGTKFTYTFDKDTVYFAHDMLYTPEMFLEFARKQRLCVQELCKSKKGRSVPCFTVGTGKRTIIAAARHHACESTGSYVLEGFVEEYLKRPIENTKLFCVPIVDLDGVTDGDQGKNRAPHDHNRDYCPDETPIYPETAAIRSYAERNGCFLGFDFHSPWHIGGENDHVYIVQCTEKKLEAYKRFGEFLEEEQTENAFLYESKYDVPSDTGWNSYDKVQTFSGFMNEQNDNAIAFTLETAYFGTPENRFSQENARELGRCFLRAVDRFQQTMK